jgi:hypothetical protein
MLCFAAAPNASALEIGLMSGDNSWQETAEWDIMQRSGATVFRMQLRQSDYNQGQVDNAFRWAAERGIVILPYLYGSAKSATQFPTQAEWEKPVWEYGSWASWVDWIVQRYGYNGVFWSENPSVPYRPVGAWEVWNEPNLPKNNPGGTTAQPENYARFLKRTSELVKAAQAKKSGSPTQVVFGGLYSKGGMSVQEFLQKASNVSGTGAAFDALGLHPYSFTNGAWGFQTFVEAARNNLNTYFGNKQLWITEIGWNVKPWAEGDANHLPITVEQQANVLRESFNWVKSVSASMNIPLVVWYIYRDNDSCSNWDCHAGLRSGGPVGGGAGGEFRPAWYAFQEETGAMQMQWPDPSPNSWHSENLGGVNTSAPDISSSGPGNLQVFAKGSDGALWYRRLTGFKWSGFSSLGGSIWSGPGAVNQGTAQTDVFATGYGNNEMFHWWLSGGTWYSGQNLGGVNTSDPDASSWGSGRLDFFARGSDNALWHRYWNGVAWSGWESLGGNLAGGPGSVSWGSNRIDVVAKKNATTISHWWYDGTWHCCEDIYGEITADPDLASRGSGRLDLVVRGTDNALWHRPYDINNGGWGAWSKVGGSLTSGVGAVAWGKDNRLDVVARTTGDVLTHWWWGPTP